jgi:hypothetical protein
LEDRSFSAEALRKPRDRFRDPFSLWLREGTPRLGNPSHARASVKPRSPSVRRHRIANPEPSPTPPNPGSPAPARVWVPRHNGQPIYRCRTSRNEVLPLTVRRLLRSVHARGEPALRSKPGD